MESSYFAVPNAAGYSDDPPTTNISELKKNLWRQEEEFSSVINPDEKIHIFLKMKPLHKKVSQNCYIIHSDTDISVNPPKSSTYAQNKQIARKLFKFSYIFQSDISQAEFFNATLSPCMDRIFQMDNLLIFSYGVTNSGKTYTMQGSQTNPGIIPRTIDYIFNTIRDHMDTKNCYIYKPDKFNEIVKLKESELQAELTVKEQLLKAYSSSMKESDISDMQNDLQMSLLEQTRFINSASTESLSTIGTNFDIKDQSDLAAKLNIDPETRFGMWISFYEIYNDNIFDLLYAPTKNKDEKRVPLKIREEMKNRIPYVEGLTHVPVFNLYEAVKILKLGEKNLQKSSNSINHSSSRSHAVFCLKLVSIKGSNVFVNQVSFCDLAGIERAAKTNANGKTLKEAQAINTSLLSLSRCLDTLMINQNPKNKNNQQQVPYRDNKLTRLFQAYFDGRGMIKMVVNINPCATCFDETVQVLKFSSSASRIQIEQLDDDKLPYKIEPDMTINHSVAWEMENNETMAQETEDDDEEDDEDDEDEDEEDDDEESDDEEEESEEVEGDEDEEGETEEDEEGETEDDEDETMDETARKNDDSEDSTANETKVETVFDPFVDMKKQSKEELFEIIMKFKKEIIKMKDASLAAQYSQRAELSTKWSKRLEEEIKRNASKEKSLNEKLKAVESESEDKLRAMEQAHKSELQKLLSEIESKKEAMVVKVERKESEDAAVQTGEDERIEELQEENELQKVKIRELNETVRLFLKERDAARNEAEAAHKKIEQLNNKLEQMRAKYDEQVHQVERVNNEENDLKEQLMEAHDEIDKLKEDYEALREEQNLKVFDAVKEVTEERNMVKKELDIVVGKFDELKKRYHEMENEFSRQKGELAAKNKQLEGVNGETEALRRDLGAWKEKTEELRGEMACWKAKFEETKTKAGELEKENVELKSVIECLQVDYNKQTQAAEAAVTRKPSGRTKAAKAKVSSKTSLASDEVIMEEDASESEQKPSALKEIHHNMLFQSEVIEDSLISNHDLDKHEASSVAKPARKKSTFNRITEIITKSPILESVRNRPSRLAKTKAPKVSVDKGEVEVVKKTSKKASSKKESVDAIMVVDDDGENEEPPMHMVEEVAVETKAKKGGRKKK